MSGLVIQVIFLVILATTVGLNTMGWFTGLLYGLATCVMLTRGMQRVALGSFGPADWVTQGRAILVGGVAALVVSESPAIPVLVTIATVALMLDWVDGQVARRTGTVSSLGARFDMEVDAFLILVLYVHLTHSLGPWVLAIGLMRYAYVVATWALPFLRAKTPPRYWCKVVAAIQGIVGVFAMSGIAPVALTTTAVAVALGLLLESFGRDIVWQWRHRTRFAVSTVDLVKGRVPS